MKRTMKMNGVCSRTVSFELDGEGRVHDVSFVGGCNGNLKGVAALSEGMLAEEIISRLKGVRCGFKPTSCPDQFAAALEAAWKGDEQE